jgi:cytochrome oxidase Cu insertion factor (SCO1/SenC/PrrC family)
MSGMGSDYSLTNWFVTNLFRSQMWHQLWWIVLCGFLVMPLADVWARRFVPSEIAEPRSRTLLRLAFGLLWIVDGVLQFQPAMPLGMADQVVRPATEGTPGWLHHLMSASVGTWDRHPLSVGIAVGFLQLAIGALLLVTRGRLSRLVGLLSVGWGVVVWVVGNGMGGIFSPSSSLYFGWPGAIVVYLIAGVFLAGPPRWFPEVFSVVAQRLVGAMLFVGFVLTWTAHDWTSGKDNPLTSMGASMGAAGQPRWLSALVIHGTEALGKVAPLTNIFMALWVVVTAWGLWTRAATSARWPTRSLITGALFWWIFAEDVGIFGGLATDVNSWLPLAILMWCAAPARCTAAPARLILARVIRRWLATLVGCVALVMLVFAVVPMVGATLSHGAEITLYDARNGGPYYLTPANSPSTPFSLTDQTGRTYTLGEHHGYYTILTFLDPKCWTDCSLLAAQLRYVASELGPKAHVDFVAVAASPYNYSRWWTQHFITRNRLSSFHHFYFVTSTSLTHLKEVWAAYNIQVDPKLVDGMSLHTDAVYVIDPRAHLRAYLPDDPLATEPGQTSSATAILQALQQSGYRPR